MNCGDQEAISLSTPTIIPHPHQLVHDSTEHFTQAQANPGPLAAQGSSREDPRLWQPQELGHSWLSFHSLSQAVGSLLTKAPSPTTLSLQGLAWRVGEGKVWMEEEAGTTRSALGRTEGPTGPAREPPAMNSREARSTPGGDRSASDDLDRHSPGRNRELQAHWKG